MTTALALYVSSFLVGALLSTRVNVIGFGMLILATTGLVAVVNFFSQSVSIRWDHFLGTWVMVQAGYVAFGVLFPPVTAEDRDAAEAGEVQAGEQQGTMVASHPHH
jgi:hypothetical protein